MLSLHLILCSLLVFYSQLVQSSITANDRFSIFEQLSSHQAYVDNNLTCANAQLYASLYWPEATFRVIGLSASAVCLLKKKLNSIQIQTAMSLWPATKPFAQIMTTLTLFSHYRNGAIQLELSRFPTRLCRTIRRQQST